MCVEIKGQGILAELAEKGRIPKTPIIGPIYAFVIDRCGNCKQGKMKVVSYIFIIVSSAQNPTSGSACGLVQFMHFSEIFSCNYSVQIGQHATLLHTLS